MISIADLWVIGTGLLAALAAYLAQGVDSEACPDHQAPAERQSRR